MEDSKETPNRSANIDSGVQIQFDCLPLRCVSRFDVPLDASPKLARRIERLDQAAKKHGTHNTYYLHQGSCRFQLTNDPTVGVMVFGFTGVVITDQDDQKTVSSDLEVELDQEVCDWVTQPIVDWFYLTVKKAVQVEFDRYILAGDLKETQHRLDKMDQQQRSTGAYLGMYL